MIGVAIPTTDGRELLLTRYTDPESELRLLLDKLRLEFPAQPPPKITPHCRPNHAARLSDSERSKAMTAAASALPATGCGRCSTRCATAGRPGRASSRSSGGVAEVKFFGRYKAGYIRDAVVLSVQDGV